MNQKIKSKMSKLEKQFPDVWFKDGGEFSDGYKNTIWTGEGSEVDGDYAFSNWGYNDTMGIHPKLDEAFRKLGLFAEFYDGGTVFIYNQ
jgi:hypothetical protein